MNSKHCVVIPIHTLQLKYDAQASIINTCNVLHSYDVYIVCPKSLDTSSLDKNIRIKQFDDKWFRSYGAYNRLCLQRMFYEAFLDYEYMLIVQTDAWVFKDELQFWCDHKYDYIGAPWCHYCSDIMKCHYIEKPTNGPIIGNGGFSLRKISKFIEVTKMMEDDKILDQYEFDKTENEDLVFMTYSRAK